MPPAVAYIASALLALGAAPMPYGYYTLLRLVACAAFMWAAAASARLPARVLPCVYGVLALLFNPIIKVHLPKEAWAVVDIAAALFLAATAKRLAPKQTDG